MNEYRGGNRGKCERWELAVRVVQGLSFLGPGRSPYTGYTTSPRLGHIPTNTLAHRMKQKRKRKQTRKRGRDHRKASE
jgi:hypothetical protein